MATIQPVITKLNLGPGNVRVVWSPVTHVDDFAPWTLNHGCGSYQDKSVHIFGTFGGMTIAIQGSIDGVVYNNLHDPGGADISKTAAEIEAILENVPFIRPLRTGGAAASVTVAIWARSYIL